MFGQQNMSSTKSQAFGTIKALLLLTEWHPRNLDTASRRDERDSDLLTLQTSRPLNVPVENLARSQWREQITEPARRADRMSWMMMGAATTLAHQADLFESRPKEERLTNEEELRRQKLCMILFIYSHQLALRLGHTSLIPQSVYSVLVEESEIPSTNKAERDMQSFLLSWVKITNLMQTVAAMAFPSPSVARHTLLDGRYRRCIEYGTALVEKWWDQAKPILSGRMNSGNAHVLQVSGL